MHIWTDTPLDEIWNQLRYLTSPSNVRNVLSGRVKTGRESLWLESETLDKRASEIASCIRQADEYFQAARTVGMETRPLLQFYGAESLAKAVILACDNALSPIDLRFHGLSTRPNTANDAATRTELQLFADDPIAWEMEQEFAITNDGVFPHLARIASDSVPAKGSVFRLKELLRFVPDLAHRYARHYGEISHCLYLYSGPDIEDDGHYSIYFTEESRSKITQVFPDLVLLLLELESRAGWVSLT